MSNIVIFDSGIGGLSVWQCLTKKLSGADYVYFADNKNFPYGDKSQQFLQREAAQNIALLDKNYDISCVVLACNTLTAVAVDYLRATFPHLLFVGTEPSVKQALNYTVNNIVVATTSLTSKSPRIFSRFNHHNVHFVPFPDLATLVENDAPQREISAYVRTSLSQLDFSFDCIVLGCTHFVLIRELFKREAFNCKIFDGNNGVADRVKNLVKRKNKTNYVNVVLSEPNQEKYEQISSFIKQQNYYN